MDERQRKASATLEAAERMVAGIQRRAQKMASVEELNAYFAADAMVLKVRELAERLRELHDPVKADDIENVYIDPSELNRAFSTDPATGLEPGAPPTTPPIPAILAIAAEDKKPAAQDKPKRPTAQPPHTTAADKPTGDDK